MRDRNEAEGRWGETGRNRERRNYIRGYCMRIKIKTKTQTHNK